jgi:hypothetical protein
MELLFLCAQEMTPCRHASPIPNSSNSSLSTSSRRSTSLARCIKEKYTYVKMQERLGQSAMRDDVLCPEFGHHATSHVYLGGEFDPSPRGRVLAGAARWAAPASDNDALAAGNNAEHRQTWLAAEALWGLKTEIGDSVLTSLSKIVQRIFSDRAAKAATTVPTYAARLSWRVRHSLLPWPSIVLPSQTTSYEATPVKERASWFGCCVHQSLVADLPASYLLPGNS